MFLAETAIQFAFQPDGWIHSIQGGFDVPRGPIGVLFYIVFVPFYWVLPRTWRAAYLAASSLLLAVATVGPAYTLTLVGLTLLGYAVIRSLARGRSYWVALVLLVGGYAVLIVHPQPGWLPPVRDPLYFYVHWAGIGYLFLKTLHVLNDVSRLKLDVPRFGEWLAYILFAPTLRMGPLYRYPDFLDQLHGEIRERRRWGQAGLRLISGLVRLALLGVIVDKLPLATLFEDPWQWSAGKFVLAVYIAPLSFFLWISGYVELSIGLGRLMGFAVPENFNYPWLSQNVAEFWQRWHITLGVWLRDYVFTPLVRRRWHFFWAFTITFLLCGFWHGNRWCYIIWGTAQGVALAVVRIWGQYWKRQQASGSPLFRRLAAWKLVNSPVSAVIAWLLTFHFEIVTIMIGMDINHTGRRVGLRAWDLLRNALAG